MNLKRVSKAIGGAAAAGLTALGTALVSGPPGVSAAEAVSVALAVVVTFNGVYWAPPNEKPDAAA